VKREAEMAETGRRDTLGGDTYGKQGVEEKNSGGSFISKDSKEEDHRKDLKPEHAVS